MQEQVTWLKSFKDGWVTRLPDTEIPDSAFSDVQNIVLNDKYLPTKAYGHRKYNSTAITTSPIRGACLYAMSSGTKYYIVACGGKLYYSTAGSGTFTALQIGGADITLDSESDVEMVQYNDCLYIVNGKYPVITNGSYTTCRMLKLSGTTASSITTWPPQGGKYMCIHQERIFIAGSSDSANGLYWTEPLSPEDWTPDYGHNYDWVGKDDGENITGVASYGGYVFVFKPRNVYRYQTLGDITSWQSARVDTTLGSLYHRTIKNFYGFLMYLSAEGVVMFDGNTARVVSEQIRDKMLALPQMINNLREWAQSSATDFNAGTVPDTIDTSDNQLIPKTIPAFQPWSDTTTEDFDAGEIKTNVVTTGDVVGPVAEAILESHEPTPDGSLGLYAYAQSFVLDSASYVMRFSIYIGRGDTGTLTASIKSDNSNSPGTTLASATSVNPTTGWVTFTLSAPVSLAASTKYWIYADLSSFSLLAWSRLSSGTYSDGDAWSSPSGILTGQDFLFRVYGVSSAASTFVSKEHDSSCAANGYGWGTFTANGTTPAGASVVYQIGSYDDSGTAWADIPGAQVETIASGSVPTIARKRYMKWKVVMTPSATTVSTFNISDVSVSSFSTGTLDLKDTTPVSLGHVFSTSSGTVTFYSATSATDLSETGWVAATWTAVTDGAISSTARRYMRIKWTIGAGASLTSIMCGGIYTSVAKSLSVIPTAWGMFESAYSIPSGQTCTMWVRTATSEGGLTSASWVAQTPNTNVADTLRLWIQVQVRLDIAAVASPPTVDSFTVNWSVGQKYAPPCAVVWKNDYWLNIVEGEATVNNVVYQYNKDGYWLRRSNKDMNAFFIDDIYLISGTSDSTGYLYYNDVETTDDGTAIDSYFVTKNLTLTEMTKIFRSLYATSKSTASWTLSYSVDDGAYTSITIALQSAVSTVLRALSGLVRGNLIKFKVRQASTDATFEFHGLGILWAPLRVFTRS